MRNPEQPSIGQRIAVLASAHDAWLELAVRVERHAEERAIAWQERHIPGRFQDLMPHQLPERLWHRYHRQEMKYGDRLARADAHARKADACAAAIR